MVVDARQQIKAELERELASLRQKLAAAENDDDRKVIKKEMRRRKSDARRLRRTAVW